jgi:hypothetical protein
MKRPGSAVGIATGYGLDCRGVGSSTPIGSRIFTLHIVQTGPWVKWVPRDFFPGIKRQGREAHHISN